MGGGIRIGMQGLLARIRRRLAGGGPDEARLAWRVLRGRPGVMIDVGAHYGSSCSAFARAGWRVFAFEPDPVNRARLAAALGALPNVCIDSRAVGERPATGVPFYRSPVSSGISGLTAFHATHEQAGLVDVTTIGELAEADGLAESGIDFLKIDTEGHDLQVLRGVPWEKTAPRMILCEFEDAKTRPHGYGFHDLADYLVARGYRIVVSEWHPIRRYGGPHDWNRFARYPCELASPAAWGNLLAVRDEELAQRLSRACRLRGRDRR